MLRAQPFERVLVRSLPPPEFLPPLVCLATFAQAPPGFGVEVGKPRSFHAQPLVPLTFEPVDLDTRVVSGGRCVLVQCRRDFRRSAVSPAAGSQAHDAGGPGEDLVLGLLGRVGLVVRPGLGDGHRGPLLRKPIHVVVVQLPWPVVLATVAALNAAASPACPLLTDQGHYDSRSGASEEVEHRKTDIGFSGLPVRGDRVLNRSLNWAA